MVEKVLRSVGGPGFGGFGRGRHRGAGGTGLAGIGDRAVVGCREKLIFQEQKIFILKMKK